MNFKTIALAILIVVLAKQLSAQQISGISSDEKIKPDKFNLSFFTGLSFTGPKDDMEAGIKSSGLDYTSPTEWFGGAKDNHFTYKYPTADLEATYYFKRDSWVALMTISCH